MNELISNIESGLAGFHEDGADVSDFLKYIDVEDIYNLVHAFKSMKKRYDECERKEA